MIIKFFAWITGGTVIYLQDIDKRYYKTISYISPFGDVWCHVYWWTKTGHAILLENGEISKESESCYITKWKKA